MSTQHKRRIIEFANLLQDIFHSFLKLRSKYYYNALVLEWYEHDLVSMPVVTSNTANFNGCNCVILPQSVQLVLPILLLLLNPNKMSATTVTTSNYSCFKCRSVIIFLLRQQQSGIEQRNNVKVFIYPAK